MTSTFESQLKVKLFCVSFPHSPLKKGSDSLSHKENQSNFSISVAKAMRQADWASGSRNTVGKNLGLPFRNSFTHSSQFEPWVEHAWLSHREACTTQWDFPMSPDGTHMYHQWFKATQQWDICILAPLWMGSGHILFFLFQVTWITWIFWGFFLFSNLLINYKS